MNISIKFIGQCPSGNHIYLTADVDGKKRNMTICRSEMNREDFDPEQVVYILIRNFVKENNLTTLREIKTGVEGHIFKV